jgi:hypothetical protein
MRGCADKRTHPATHKLRVWPSALSNHGLVGLETQPAPIRLTRPKSPCGKTRFHLTRASATPIKEKQLRKSLTVSGLALAAALLAAWPAAALDVNVGTGGLLGGGSNGNATATVDTGLLDSTGNDATARVNLGGLNGSGSDPTTANVTLGGAGGTNGDVLLDLFGPGGGIGSDSSARVALGTGNLGTGGGNDAVLNLFGPGDTGSGAPGDSGSGGNGNGGAIPGKTVGTVQIAAVGNAPSSKCFTPNAEQEAKLIARHDYSQATASWGAIGQLKVVDVGLCSSAGSGLAGQHNIAQLQSYISAHPEIRAGLDKLGRSPGEVIAADKTGDTLTLYVM